MDAPTRHPEPDRLAPLETYLMSCQPIGSMVRLLAGLGLGLAALAGCSGDGPLEPGKRSGPGARAPGFAAAPGEIEDPEPREVLRLEGQAIIEVSGGATIGEIEARYGTTTLGAIPGRGEYLVEGPAGLTTDDLTLGLFHSGLCDDSEPNYTLEPPESEQGSFAFYDGGFGHGDYVDQMALARIRAPEAQQIATGAGILVAVIDTGADLDHPDLVDNLVPGIDFVDEDNDPSDLPNNIDDDQDGVVDEATGHGTHVAGIIAAVAPAASILPVRVLDSDGIGDAFDVARGIYFAIDAGADVINLSLGLDASVRAVRRAIDEAMNRGILVVTSAGNRGTQIGHHFPASLSEVMTIAATDAGDRKAYFSNFGSNVSVSAPGVGIMSTYWNGGYALWSGTSMAAPFVAGAGALRLSLGPLPPGDLRSRIENAAFPLDNVMHAYRGQLGEGRLDLLPLVQMGLAGNADGRGGVNVIE